MPVKAARKPGKKADPFGALGSTMLDLSPPVPVKTGYVFRKPAKGPVAEAKPETARKPFELHLLGTREFYLRPSSLGLLVRCPLMRVLEFMLATADEGGRPAQTGSLTHKAVEAFHRQKGPTEKKIEAAFGALASNAAAFPLADLDDARIFTRHYVADPRNQAAKILANERQVNLVLKPHPLDPTGQAVHIQGTLDQIRQHEDGRIHLYDLKTGMPSGAVMLGDHAYQIAAYTLAGRASGWPELQTGYLIRAAAYRTQGARLPSPEGVFWKVPFDVRRCWLLMDSVRLTVALIRSGEVMVGPGVHCSYCPLGGLDGCLPVAENRLGLTVVEG